MGRVSYASVTLGLLVSLVARYAVPRVDAVPLRSSSSCEALLTSSVESSSAVGAALSPADVAAFLDCASRRRQGARQNAVEVDADNEDDALAAQLNATLKTLTEGRKIEVPTGDDVKAIWAVVGRLSKSSSSAVSADEVTCDTVRCLASRAASTFDACSGLRSEQCTALVALLENLGRFHRQLPVSSTGEKEIEEETEEAELALRGAVLSRLGDLLAEYRKWRHQQRAARSRRSVVEPEVGVGENGSGNDVTTFDDWVKSTISVEAAAPASGDVSKPETEMETASRRKRSVLPPGIPFKMPEKMTPETQAILEAYLAWREKNGYGKISGRWG